MKMQTLNQDKAVCDFLVSSRIEARNYVTKKILLYFASGIEGLLSKLPGNRHKITRH